MIALIKSLLGFIAKEALALDVRSPAEFKDGHSQGALNFPLQNLNMQMNKLKKEQVIINGCHFRSYSEMAKRMLKSNGFLQVYNGGPWANLS